MINLDRMYTSNCVQCQDPRKDVKEAKLCIFITNKTKIVLRADDQTWPGRCVVVPFEHIPKGCNASEEFSESMQDLEECKKKLFIVFKDAFGMTIDNVAELGNLTRDHEGKDTVDPLYYHKHQHFIPRYQNGANVNGKIFIDPQWKKPLNLDHQKLQLPQEELEEIRETIQLKLIEMKLVRWDELEPTFPSSRVHQAAQKAGLF